jgi:chromosome segregation ATPase
MKSDKNSLPPRSSEPVAFIKSDKPSSPRVAGAAPVGSNGEVPEAEAAGVDKIRNLLFGNQMQDYDRRFSGLEERFLQRFKELELETSRNLGAFETNAKKQVDSLATQLRDEKDQRADADREIDRLLREQNQALEKRIRVLSDQLSQLDRDMADRLTHESQALRDELKQKHADIRQAIENMFGELSNVKTDRTLLASLFVEVAKCLNQDIGSKAKGPAESLRGSSTQLT